MQSVYRFWSLDPVYQRIVKVVKSEGVVVPGGDNLHTFARLYNGVHYRYGKAQGRLYPSGSYSAKLTASFPAVLYITAENRKKLAEIEKFFGLDKVPEYRRRIPHPDQEPWLPPLRSLAYRNEEAYLYSQFNPGWGSLLVCDQLRQESISQ